MPARRRESLPAEIRADPNWDMASMLAPVDTTRPSSVPTIPRTCRVARSSTFSRGSEAACTSPCSWYSPSVTMWNNGSAAADA